MDYLDRIEQWVKDLPKLVQIGFALLTIGSIGSTFFRAGIYDHCNLIGFALISIWLCVRIPRILPRDHIVDKWDTFIPGAEGMADKLIEKTEQRIISVKAPGIRAERQTIAPGLLQGILGRRKLFLVISNDANYRLRLCRMYVNAEDYGTKLHVSWFLAHHPGLWRKLTTLAVCVSGLRTILAPAQFIGQFFMAKESAVLGLDSFDEQELRMYATNIHRCLLEAVQELGKECRLDTSGTGIVSSGFLGIS